MWTKFFFLGEPGSTGGGQSQRTGGDKVKLSFLRKKACKIFGFHSRQGHMQDFHIDVKSFFFFEIGSCTNTVPNGTILFAMFEPIM